MDAALLERAFGAGAADASVERTRHFWNVLFGAWAADASSRVSTFEGPSEVLRRLLAALLRALRSAATDLGVRGLGGWGLLYWSGADKRRPPNFPGPRNKAPGPRFGRKNVDPERKPVKNTLEPLPGPENGTQGFKNGVKH